MIDRLREWRGFILFVLVMLVFRSAVADWNQVPSGSMLPAILVGDRIVVDKLAYDLRIPFTQRRIARWADPARGDVVTFTSPEDERLLVKRVIGLPGDLVGMVDNRLTINGEPLDYRPLQRRGSFLRFEERLPDSVRSVVVQAAVSGSRADSFAPVQVPSGHYLMLGDNRDHSRDSRAFGFVARERILGRATAVAFSLDYENHYAPRTDRFLADLD